MSDTQALSVSLTDFLILLGVEVIVYSADCAALTQRLLREFPLEVCFHLPSPLTSSSEQFMVCGKPTETIETLR